MNASAMPVIAPDQAGDRSALAGRLVVLGTQMLRLAGELSRREAAGEAADLPADSALLSLLAEDLYRDRRRRARHLPDRLLGEPAWDILLDLYVAAGRGQAVSVSNACLSADAPASTALRWLQHLEREGLVVRLPDPTDARRHYVRLTESGLARMTAYFAECRGDLVGEVGFGEKALRLES